MGVTQAVTSRRYLLTQLHNKNGVDNAENKENKQK